MEQRNDNSYTINPDTGRKIKIGGPTWRRLSTKYYTSNDGSFTDELIPDPSIYPQEKKWKWRLRKVVRDPKYKRFVPILVGTDEWNKRYLQYEWNGREFGAKRKQRLSKEKDTVEKRREAHITQRKIDKFNRKFNRKIDQGRSSDVIDSKLGYGVTHYNTLKGNMSKEWMNVKRTKKDFRTRYDIDEKKVWVRLPDSNSEEEVKPLQLLMNEPSRNEFKQLAKKYIMNGLRDYAQCFTDIMAYNLMHAPQNSELKILPLTDDRLGSLRIVHRDRIDEWLNDYLKWYANGVEEQETEGSGFVYLGWIGFHIEMFPLRTRAGYKHPIPTILGQSVVNPNIDDNRCLQRCLILASEGGHKIIANRNMSNQNSYNKWWKQPEKNKIFGHTVHEIEKAMDICGNKPFEVSTDNFAKLESLLNVSINVFEVTLLPGYDDKSKDKYEHFKCYQFYHGRNQDNAISLCLLNDTRGENDTPKHFMFIKDLKNFKQRIHRQSDAKNRHLARNKQCRFCDFIGSATTVRAHEVQAHREQMDERDLYELTKEPTRLRFTNQRYEMPAPVVVYADFESAIDDKNRHKPIMLSCLAVSRIPAFATKLQVFHAPNENENDIHPFLNYLIQLQERIKQYLFKELPLERTVAVESDYQSTKKCPFCHKVFGDSVKKVRHHAHVSGEYSNGTEIKHYEAGQYICTCCNKCNLQLSFNKKNYRLPVYFHNGSHYDFTFIMKLIASYASTHPGNDSVEVIPTSEDKEMQIE